MESALAASFTPEAAAAVAVDPATLRSGGEASPEYLSHLVTVMAKRAVQACR
jgi:carbon-monoxide dehydrogenase medium subunit